MYAFVTLFGLLALLHAAAGDPQRGRSVNWAAYILATVGAAVVALLRPAADRRAAAHLRRRPDPAPARAASLSGPWRSGFAYSAAVLVMQLVPLARVRPQAVPTRPARRGRLAQRDLRPPVVLRRRLQHGLGALGLPPGRHHRAPRPRCGRCSCCSRCCCSAAAARARRDPRRRRDRPDRAALIVGRAFDRELFEVRYFLVVVPLLLAPRRAARDRLDSTDRAARLLVAGVIILTLLLGLADQQTNDGQPAAVRLPRRDQARSRRTPGRRASCSSSRPTCATCSTTTRPTCAARAAAASECRSASEGSPVFVLASFQDNKLFFNRTNKVVGQLDFFRRLVRRFKKPQTNVWEFR